MAAETTAKILIVEDEQALLDSYAAILETRYEVDTAASGEAALATIDEETDVVLLDRRLPDYSGAEILSTIRERGFECSVFFCSAVVPDAELVALEPAGYLHKPVGADALFDAIGTQLDAASHPPEIREYLRLKRLRETLESARPLSELRSDPRYDELLERIEELEQTADPSRLDSASAV